MRGSSRTFLGEATRLLIQIAGRQTVEDQPDLPHARIKSLISVALPPSRVWVIVGSVQRAGAVAIPPMREGVVIDLMRWAGAARVRNMPAHVNEV